MPHGTPDWGHTGPKETTFGLDDLGEHAVRLGSPHTWDRRGDAIWLTTFEEGLGDVLPVRGLGAGVIGLYAGLARQGAFCVRLEAGLGAADWAGVDKQLPFPIASGIGLEFSFAGTLTGGWYFARLSGRDAAGLFHAEVEIDIATGNVQYMDAGGILVPLVTVTLNLGPPVVHHVLKLVIDFVSHEYVRCIVDDLETPMAGINYDWAGAVGARELLARCGFRLPAAAATSGYIDTIIVTQNEP